MDASPPPNGPPRRGKADGGAFLPAADLNVSLQGEVGEGGGATTLIGGRKHPHTSSEEKRPLCLGEPFSPLAFVLPGPSPDFVEGRKRFGRRRRRRIMRRTLRLLSGESRSRKKEKEGERGGVGSRFSRSPSLSAPLVCPRFSYGAIKSRSPSLLL